MAEPDIFTFTEIHMPTSVVDMSMNFVDGSSEYGRKLVASLRQLREALGSSYMSWGRLIERPEYILLVAGILSNYQQRFLFFFSLASLMTD